MPSLGVDALLDAAEREFAGGGFDGGSLRSIMREADVDPGAIHYHFGGGRHWRRRYSTASWRR